MTDQQPTADRLADALLEALGPAGDELATRARTGEFDDYRSPHAMPQTMLVAELRQLGGPAAFEFAARVIDGEFDATVAESDAWARSPEGRAAFDALAGRPNRAARRAARRRRH